MYSVPTLLSSAIHHLNIYTVYIHIHALIITDSTYIIAINIIITCMHIEPGRHPPISTMPPVATPLAVPHGMSCGGVFEGKTGTFMSPNYPSHLNNQRCAWVIRIPDGYYFQIDYPELQMDQRYCLQCILCK